MTMLRFVPLLGALLWLITAISYRTGETDIALRRARTEAALLRADVAARGLLDPLIFEGPDTDAAAATLGAWSPDASPRPFNAPGDYAAALASPGPGLAVTPEAPTLLTDDAATLVGAPPTGAEGVPLVALPGERLWLVPWPALAEAISERSGTLLEIGAPDAQHPAVAQLAFLEGPPLRMAEQEIRDRDAVRELMFGSTSGLALLFFTAMPLLTLIAAGPSVRRLEERASERARVDLLQRFSHELRTPAAAVQSLVGTLKSGAVEDPADQQQFLELALEEAGRLSRGLTRLMLAARGEGQLEVSPQAVDLVPWAHGVARRWAPRIDPLELHLPQRCIAMADLSRLDEAVEVLLDNATKYGKAPVFLSVTPTRSGVELAVEDAGPGVDEADRRHIFDKLVRGNQRQGEGFGLGLWIVREVARAHRGSVELRGNNRFVITLPAAAEG